jgi:hypothetical protein
MILNFCLVCLLGKSFAKNIIAYERKKNEREVVFIFGSFNLIRAVTRSINVLGS